MYYSVLVVIFIITLVIGFVSCASTLSRSRYEITPEEVEIAPGNKAGVLILENGDTIFFKCSHVFVDRKVIRINSEDIRQTILWRNVRTIHIYNSCLQDEYIKNLQKINTGIQKHIKANKSLKKNPKKK